MDLLLNIKLFNSIPQWYSLDRIHFYYFTCVRFYNQIILSNLFIFWSPLDHCQGKCGQSNSGSGTGSLQGVRCESLHQQGGGLELPSSGVSGDLWCCSQGDESEHALFYPSLQNAIILWICQENIDAA